MVRSEVGVSNSDLERQIAVKKGRQISLAALTALVNALTAVRSDAPDSFRAGKPICRSQS